MFDARYTGACCAFPRQAYSAADLPAEYHSELWQLLFRLAYRTFSRLAYDIPEKGVEPIRTAAQRRGLRDRAEEAASTAYAEWLSLSGSEAIARGDHAAAVWSVVTTLRRRRWQTRVDARRESYRAATAERLAAEARLKQRNLPDPSAVAGWSERLEAHCHRKAADRVAKGIGTTRDRLASYAAGINETVTRARIVRGPIPAPLPDPFPPAKQPMTSVDARHGWILRPDPDGTLPEIVYRAITVKESASTESAE